LRQFWMTQDTKKTSENKALKREICREKKLNCM
jgi:hypothetical protein